MLRVVPTKYRKRVVHIHRMAVAGAMNAWVDTEEVVFDGKSPIGNRYYVKLVTF